MEESKQKKSCKTGKKFILKKPKVVKPKQEKPKQEKPKQEKPKQEKPKQEKPKQLKDEVVLETDNDKKNKIELENRESLKNNKEYSYLYPNLNDEKFNIKLAEKKEFNELKVIRHTKDVEKVSEKLCNQKDFEPFSHQLLVKNFLSSQTPYNNLLLFHGLGTGKTCSAILLCEEMRNYYKQFGINKKIIIVASPNVQTNFRLQLFNDNKLKEVNGIWNLNACTGNGFLKEINPMNMKGLTKKDIIRQINTIIRKSYKFMGSEQFSNYVEKILIKHEGQRKKNLALKREFSNRLIVIDEVHNLRDTEDNQKKNISKNLFKVAKHSENLKLLLLSATPMFNSPLEIIWLLNLMNTNDNRSTISVKDVFNNDGTFIVDENDKQIGKELLIRKATGYISYVRGEDPYTFPYRIYPSMYMSENTILSYKPPRFQLNKTIIEKPIQKLDLCIVPIGSYQNIAYNFILQKILKEHNIRSNVKIGFQQLSAPIQALDIIYPYEKFDKIINEGRLEDEETNETISYRELIGKRGLDRVVNYNKSDKTEYTYKTHIRETYGPIFSKNEIGKYSSKMKFICNQVENSEGIVLIYSQYIDGGCVPIALCLEEMGYTRYGRPNLFKKPPTKSNGLKYSMITGNLALSPNNMREIKKAIKDNNINGENIKVIIISEAASEGIDLKNVRQVNILEPWYNINRLEQIIGRAVRNCSHKNLPFNKHNVQIFLYGTQLREHREEAADMYIYRTAEHKSINIGRVTRVLKETAVDCLLNKNVMTEQSINQEKELVLSTGNIIKYKIGDKAYSPLCDFMENCDYTCNPNKDITKADITTYDENFIVMNIDVVIKKIKELFREKYAVTIEDILKYVNKVKKYPLEQVYSALTLLIENNTLIYDKLNRTGTLVNIGEYYLFQPIELSSIHQSYYDRVKPIDAKANSIKIKLKDTINVVNVVSNIESQIKTLIEDYNNTYNNIPIKLGTKDINWYIAAGNSRKRLQQYISISDADFDKCVFEHMFDVIPTKEKIDFIKKLLFNKDLNDFEKKMKKIVKEKIIKIGTNSFILVTNFMKKKLEYFKITNKLTLATPTEIERINEKINDENDEKFYNDIIGKMNLFKDKQYVIFKIVNKKVSRSSVGFRCDQKGKVDILRDLNIILSQKKYTNENVEHIKNSRELCIDQEIILRYFNNIKKDNKDWFINLEQSFI